MKRKRTKSPKAEPIERYWLNRKHAARACRVSVQSFDAWGIKPVAKIGRETFYLAADIIENRVANAVAKTETTRPPAEESEGDREKTMLIREQRIAQEMKNQKTRRETAPIAVIDWTLAKVASQLAAILEAIPLRMKQLVPHMTGSEIGIVEREIVKARNLAAGITVDFDEFDREVASKTVGAASPEG